MAAHYAKLKSADILVSFMVHKGYVDRDGAGQPLYRNGMPQLQYSRFARQVGLARTEIAGTVKPVSRQMITQLCRGIRSSCTTDLGLAIERVLDVPDKAIFNVLPKSRDERQTVKTEAAA